LPTFKPGVHEVTDEVADIARRDAPARVVVSAVRPELATPVYDGAPLTLDDIRFGTTRAPAADESEDEEEDNFEPEHVPDAYPCRLCDRTCRSEEELRWHVEFTHSIHHAEQEAAEPAPEPEESTEEEELDLLAWENPSELPPWQRPGV
jgi:hypothetical protein